MKTPESLKLKNLGEKLSYLDGLSQKKPTDARLSAVSVLRVTEGAKDHILAQLPCRRLVVTADPLAARSLVRKLEGWGVKASVLPHRDDMLMAHKIFSRSTMHERAQTLALAAANEAEVIVTSADSLLQRFPSRRLVARFSVRLKKEDVIAPSDLSKKLVSAGYIRQDMVAEIGDFALRGDILDIYSPDKRVYRINFFDELIENIKIIDIDSMMPIGEINDILLAPMSDILLDEKGFEEANEAIGMHINAKHAPECKSELSVGAIDASNVWVTPFIASCTQTILEFLKDGEPFIVVFDEPKVVWEKLNILKREFDGRVRSLLDASEILPMHADACISLNELSRQLLGVRKFSFSSLSLGNPIFEPKYTVEPICKPVSKYYLDPQSIFVDLKTFLANGMRIIFACGSKERAMGIAESLRQNDVYAQYSEDGDCIDGVTVTPLKIETGVIYPSAKLVLIGTAECIGKQHAKSVGSGLNDKKFTAPKAGDYVVHRVHGVGLCEGTVIMRTGDFDREYIVLKYRDGDTLYVATDQMSNLQKFVGEEHPALNKLGGKEFEREKEKVRASVRKLAVNLIDLYAKREKQSGFKYSEDTVWQKEFEDAFEYEETADQLKAIDDVKRDMEQGRIMDRLLVGDVGFGKTEVAFRAMFKTVLDNKQAVLLAPTTILAKQHFENLQRRLKPFGIKCGLLTRLQSAKENSELIAGLKEGSVHMAVATHKVLGDKVEFKDLGLLVLDEEQRFGVEHKEKLKEKYPLVNVLTLSATPIPRTLNMSLSGIRDISMLETPPEGRLPVQTYVIVYSDALCEDAVNRELSRGGQTLVLINDIQRLDNFAERLRTLCPQAKIVTAHGQLPSHILERRIGDFYAKKYDVLVSTTIIENGIDLPDANTLIVIDSERFGLSQLYQLRGRVGRRGTLAHAYFTVPENGILSTTADKRLKTLLDNTEIGSGFRVALSDLSIRGAGTLLGAEQSGHIEKVGYEMYLELLEEAVQEIKTGVAGKPVRDVEMKVDAAAYIREGYVSMRDKLRVYKQIASVSGETSRSNLLKELAEVYGPVDVPLENLINIAMLKNFAANYGVSRIVINKNGAVANFYEADAFSNEPLMRAIAEHGDKVMLTNTIPPSLIFEVTGQSAEQRIKTMLDFFASI